MVDARVDAARDVEPRAARAACANQVTSGIAITAAPTAKAARMPGTADPTSDVRCGSAAFAWCRLARDIRELRGPMTRATLRASFLLEDSPLIRERPGSRPR
ncbi:hypothetical protein AWH51_03140 [Clavibacter tessellarius]|uniref:Uncharacterized protein n=1 Tax=Clavibacter tessellarius TaxID=31965 RepID=A0A154V4Q1_9MICO|nr:hypothetical protein AWH51_03140 [Clavibacter michiganensis subsp. tessellarius]